MSAAMPTMMTVPTMAFATPPPDSPAGTGFRTKKFQSSDEAPLAIRSATMSTSARTAVNESRATSPVMTALVAWRRRLRALTALGSPPRPRAPPAK